MVLPVIKAFLLLLLLVAVIVVIVLLNIGVIKLPKIKPPKMQSPECEVCTADPNQAQLPECGNCPSSAPQLKHCARFDSLTQETIKFPKIPNETTDSNKWTIMFWVKINNLNAKELVLMKKGSSELGASPSIIFGKDPAYPMSCIKFNFSTPGSPGVWTPDPLEPNWPARPAGSFTSSCPNFNPLREGEWKFLAWVQDGPSMTFFDGQWIWLHSPNTPLNLSPGNLVFDQGPESLQGPTAEFKHISVCNRALIDEEVRQIYAKQSKTMPKPTRSILSRPYRPSPPGAPYEGLSPMFQSLISVGPYRRPPAPFEGLHSTRTYKKKGPPSNQSYELFSIENYSNRQSQRRLAMIRSLTQLRRV